MSDLRIVASVVENGAVLIEPPVVSANTSAPAGASIDAPAGKGARIALAVSAPAGASHYGRSVGLDRSSPDARESADSDADGANEKLASAIARRVRIATRGGVRDLEVRVCDGVVRLRGRCSTFYCKQLAQHALKDATGGARLANEIDVW